MKKTFTFYFFSLFPPFVFAKQKLETKAMLSKDAESDCRIY